MIAIKHYILIDPFNSVTSGVTTYTNSVEKFLNESGIKTTIISRLKNEEINNFRKRVAKEVSNFPKFGLLVEAPESLYSTSYIDEDTLIHIRLHGSRHFGNWLQGKKINSVDLAAEQREISRARLVTAPSRAAIASSSHIFQYPQQISCYPNPLPILSGISIQIDIDILFLGRWQPLKGIEFFKEIAKKLPNLRIAVACTEQPPKLPNGITYIPIKTTSDRYSALTRSRVIIIPSFFETASMVGLEAFVAGRQVITWEHLGLTEYADEPCLYRAKSWCIDSLILSFKKAIIQETGNAFKICNYQIQTGFSDAINHLILKGNLNISTMPFPASIIDWNNIFTRVTDRKINSNKMYFIKRKLRKLIRDPLEFWKDSFICQLFKKNTKENRSPDLSPAMPISILAESSSENLLTSQPIFLGSLNQHGKINLKDPLEKPKSWITVLVHSNADTEEVMNLRTELNKFTDFAPLRNESLNHILNEIDPEDAPISILNRIDLKNKERIARINNIVLINTSANVIQALRCCGTSNRIILVLTETVMPDLSLMSIDTDAIICLASHPAAKLKWRRKNVIESKEQLPGMIRKVLQEIGPKTPDMLLPLIGGTDYNPELIEFDARRYQGIIRLKPGPIPQFGSLREYITYIAGDVHEMLILDSIYMRYRSLCEAIEAGESPAMLIEFCLQDGVLFDVN